MAFPSSPSNGDLHTEFGRTFKYASATNSWSVATPDAPVDNTPTTQGYVDSASLPLADVVPGSKAFVEDGNKLFIFTGSGWFEIATINTAPTITAGAGASYTLNSDGTPTVITLQATDPEGTPIIWGYQVTSGSLEDTTVTNVGGQFTITPGSVAATFDLSFTASDGVNIDTSASSFSLSFIPPQAEFTTPGTYSWTAPEGVTSVSVVAVGGGGSGGYTGTGGGGGGLGWKNNIPVVPGQSYTVVVGAGGAARSGGVGNGNAGGNSYFISTSTVRGGGGGAGQYGAGSAPDYQIAGGVGGTYTGDGGGNGGSGGTMFGTAWGAPYLPSGAGGAGGYSGNGGNGGAGTDFYASTTGNAGEAGATDSGAGGGGASSKNYSGYTTGGAGGGGVGILGKGITGGATGVPSNAGPWSSGGGFPGSGGVAGETKYWSTNISSVAPGGYGGAYGGGGGGSSSQSTGVGGNGAVRIIWGEGRAFPSTNTGNV